MLKKTVNTTNGGNYIFYFLKDLYHDLYFLKGFWFNLFLTAKEIYVTSHADADTPYISRKYTANGLSPNFTSNITRI